ncbi:glycosyltransferase family 2 protein [Luteolibacter pohnpeiensis]|uniref:Glycosyltransferase family 2 protein n=1 Tax=Luteolibacter pohnpeiensis TaxID=454153 RepID=A0A934SA22_9BACT|nr:glycosyltransferase family 2 protein [Luteolibacter pohnpeiensis]MBK1884039.1 glycosyltransferase family 2 protein [Luteolibacter pohnpeiensis]
MAKISLCMIVKDEAHVIRRCLEKALPLMDHLLVVDTGSTDGTQEVIRDFLEESGLPGVVIDEPWKDFAYNRSFAMSKLREHADIDYGLMLDADNYLVFEKSFDVDQFKRGLSADLYDVQVRTGPCLHYCPLLFSNRRPYRYLGVLHEFLEVNGSREVAKGFLSVQMQDSARNRNPNKYRDDANVLENVLKTESDPFFISRYTFYLAQSYRDADELELALDAYLRRAHLGGWKEEVFFSFYQAGLLREKLGHEPAAILESYLSAFEASPSRAESLHAAARFCRNHGKYHQAYLFAKQGIERTLPEQPLFAQTWVYDYGMMDEFSIAAYWAGKLRESFDACVKLLKKSSIPPNERERIRRNAQYAIDALGQPKLANLLPAA